MSKLTTSGAKEKKEGARNVLKRNGEEPSGQVPHRRWGERGERIRKIFSLGKSSGSAEAHSKRLL